MIGSACRGKIREALLVFGWLAAVGTGLFLLWQYNMRPGSQGKAPVRWPEEVSWASDGKCRLVLFVHPQCPCSRASLAELELLVKRLGQAFSVRIFFVQPEGMEDAWVRDGLWQRAAAIPEAEVIVDRGGREAQRFGAQTSGATYLYAPDGGLLFEGGITAARGHEGDNVGRAFVELKTREQGGGCVRTPVFGCALQDEKDGKSG